MRNIFILYISLLFIISCKKPFGQDEMVNSDFPDSLTYPQITEIEDNDDPFQFYRLARIKYSQGKVDEAIEFTNEAIRLDDENALYYYLLARLYATEGRTNLALDNALKSYSLGYVNPQLQVMIAQQYYELGKVTEGEKYLDVALKKNPNDPNKVFLKAVIYLQQNDTVKAKNWLNKTIALDSGFVDAYSRKVEVLIAQDSIDKAIQQLHILNHHDPENQEVIYKLATLNMEKEALNVASFWFRKLINIDSGNTAAYIQLAQIKLTKNQHDSVRYYAGMALTINEGLNNARLLLARSYDDQYRYSQALEEYQEIIRRDSTFEIALTEMEVLQKKIAYLRRKRQQQDSLQNEAPAPTDTLNSEN